MRATSAARITRSNTYIHTSQSSGPLGFLLDDISPLVHNPNAMLLVCLSVACLQSGPAHDMHVASGAARPCGGPCIHVLKTPPDQTCAMSPLAFVPTQSLPQQIAAQQRRLVDRLKCLSSTPGWCARCHDDGFSVFISPYAIAGVPRPFLSPTSHQPPTRRHK